ELELPEHQPWDHEITLQEGKTPTFEPIYALSEKELKETREYIKERLNKGHIQESKSPAGYPILFVPKKNGQMRMCVDYRKLSNKVIREDVDDFVEAYLDDILVDSTSEKEHVQLVQKVLECFRKAKLRLRPEKCEFHKTTVEFLGFQIGIGKIEVSPKKVEIV